MPYLKRDWIGQATGIVYGRAGDKVEVIRKFDQNHTTVKKDLLFIVRNEDLDYDKDKEDSSVTKAAEESTGRI